MALACTWYTCEPTQAMTHLHAVGHDAGGGGLAEADAPLEVVARRVQQRRQVGRRAGWQRVRACRGGAVMQTSAAAAAAASMGMLTLVITGPVVRNLSVLTPRHAAEPQS